MLSHTSLNTTKQERSKANRARRKRDQEAVAERERTAAELQKASAEQLLTQLETKHATMQEQRQKLNLEEERVKKQQIYLGAARSALEESRFDELLRAAEREAKANSLAQATNVNKQALVMKKERANARAAKAAEMKAAAELDAQRKKETATQTREMKAFTRSELARRKQNFQTIRYVCRICLLSSRSAPLTLNTDAGIRKGKR